jgi:hypothetical protein
MSDLFNELNEIIGEGLFKNIDPTLNLNKGEDRVSDIDRLRELSDAVLIEKHWGDAEVKEFMVEVRFYIKAIDAGEASRMVENVLDKESIEFQIESSEEL